MKRNVRSIGALCAFLATMAGCGGTPSTPAGPTNYTLSITHNSAVLRDAVVLYSAGFLTPDSNVTTLVVAIDPQPKSMPTVSWSTGNGNVVTVSQSDTRVLPGLGGAQPTAPPGGTYLFMGSKPGSTTVTAQVGAPVNGTISATVNTYGEIAVGCGFRYTPAYSFGSGASTDGLNSDLYSTEPAVTNSDFDACQNSVFITGTSALHFPYGGILIPGSALEGINASQWRNAGTQVPYANVGGVLLFKTKNGAIVKALVPVGPYEVTDSAGNFPY